MLRYWTSRYLITLLIGLAIVFLVFASWFRYTTIESRLEFMNYLADDMVNLITHLETRPPAMEGQEGMNFREIKPEITITDENGRVLSANKSPMGKRSFTVTEELNQQSEGTFKWHDQNMNREFYVVKRAIQVNGAVIGFVYVTEDKEKVTEVGQQFGQLFIFILAIALLGWLAIFFLSKRLVNPIKEVAIAAQTVQQGSYAIKLPEQIKERELHELTESFRGMVERLQQLEKTRTELLAGVTHELKTPVTSISSLLQAIQDGVVVGEEQQVFLGMAIEESEKMKTMVADLVNFNSFAVDAIPLKLEEIEINQLVTSAVRQWESSQLELELDISVTPLSEPVILTVDRVRLQQIISNLLNNARDAMEGKGKITITLEEADTCIYICTKDSGPGICVEEQSLIFERFFRGNDKRYKKRGLGIGLTLSKMMAQSLNGDLRLEHSDASGTIFTLELPKK